MEITEKAIVVILGVELRDYRNFEVEVTDFGNNGASPSKDRSSSVISQSVLFGSIKCNVDFILG